jgi:hypothetical protein
VQLQHVVTHADLTRPTMQVAYSIYLRGARSVLRTLAAAAFASSPLVHADAPFLANGRAGFVVSDIKYALAEDAARTGACPKGMSLNAAEIFASTLEGKRRKGESDEQYGKRTDAGGMKLSTAPGGQNVCLNPEVSEPDPYYRTVDVSNVRVDGIDLDGVDSGAGAAGGTCPHQEFVGRNGEPGVDNQFYRVVGCSRSFQSTGLSNSYATEMLTGSWGIVLTLSGVDDLRNDEEVDVGLSANADPIQLGPTREPLAYATYAMDQDPRFRARTRGRISDGVLITDPVDVRFRHVVNSMRLERPLRAARLRVTISAEGILEGYLAGYTPVEDMYDFQYGFRNGKDAAGELAPMKLRFGTANGAARVLGHTCPGVYHSLYKYADGHPDAQTGRCTSISTQYRIKAIPAFVVDVATDSVNTKLTQKGKSHGEP